MDINHIKKKKLDWISVNINKDKDNFDIYLFFFIMKIFFFSKNYRKKTSYLIF